MSGERTNVVGIVILTTCITSGVMVGAWFAASRYLGQPNISAAPHEDLAAPAPRKKTPRALASNRLRGGAHDSASPSDSVPGATPGTAENDSSGEDEGDAPSSVAPPVEAESESPSAAIGALSAADKGNEARTIMEEAQRRTEAKFYHYDGLLQSFDAKERVTEKRWTFDRAGSHGQSKAVLRFTAPAEVKGVALLIENHPERASDQWMWTPAIERDRRIALQDRSTRFFGTDFSFEDLEERDVDQSDYSMLGDDPIEGAACWKIQLKPKPGRSSQYSRSIAWVRKDNYALARLEHFVGNELVKRLTYSSIENIEGIWTARQLEMADLRRASRTRLTLQQVKYNVPVKKEDFTLQAIRR